MKQTTEEQTLVKRGRALRVGDTIKVWWQPGRDTITQIQRYTGPLAHIWESQGGAREAKFALNPTGMTIEPQNPYTLIQPTRT